MRKRLLLLAITILAATAILAAACGGDDDDADTGGATATPTNAASATGDAVEPLEVTVTAENFSFDTATINAAPGQVVNVTLKNDGSTPHSFTVGSTDVAEAEGGEEGTGSFTASASTIEFHCKYHSQMTGTITVSDDEASGGLSGGGY
jgi:plastocyanin